MSNSKIVIHTVDWLTSKPELYSIRHKVFVEEQKVPEEIEIDVNDPIATHVIATFNGEPVGTARMLNNGHIGRVAVLKAQRSKGIGTYLVKKLIEEAKILGYRYVDLSSQAHAVTFYEKMGFAIRGDEYLEANIPHQDMVLSLTD